jgi:hypothetical protein
MLFFGLLDELFFDEGFDTFFFMNLIFIYNIHIKFSLFERAGWLLLVEFFE